ncbi:lysine transporter LysE [Streptomyces sp. NPDC090077]|uniref:lysine transporter LysE n=1 Tax=Streptomyces sp. NPDC090077 TaxID=3365938 RepID=UPI003805F5F1
MRVRRAVKAVGDFVIEAAGEFVGELILSLLACALLGGLALAVHLSWSASPRLTVAGAGLLALLFAHGAWRTFRDPAEGSPRGFAAVTAACFTLAAGTAGFLLVYGGDCGCL